MDTLLDNCGECVTPEHAATARPYLLEPDGESGTRAYYRCGTCGHRWWTSWMVGTEGLSATHDPRSAA